MLRSAREKLLLVMTWAPDRSAGPIQALTYMGHIMWNEKSAEEADAEFICRLPAYHTLDKLPTE